VESEISQAQSALAEAVETAQEVAAYEPDEDETTSASVIKKALKDLIDDLRTSSGTSAQKEREALEAQELAISALEKQIRERKATYRILADQLNIKLQLKRLGGEEFKTENVQLMQRVDAELAGLDESKREDKKKITALKKDKAALQSRIDKTDAVLRSIGGQLTEAEAKTLILQKLYDIVNQELNRYLNSEKRKVVQIAGNLWTKYALSSQALESEQARTLGALNEFLVGLRYLA
jgi:type I restriction enzyme M protein